MGNNEGRPALHQLIHTLLNHLLGTGVDRACRLVKNKRGRVGYRGSGYGEHLALSLAETAAVRFDNGLITVGELADKAVGVGELCRGDNFLVRGVEPAVADVLHDRIAEQISLLQNDAERAAEICLFDFIDIDSVVTYLAVLNIVKTVYQIGYRGLARAR